MRLPLALLLLFSGVVPMLEAQLQAQANRGSMPVFQPGSPLPVCDESHRAQTIIQLGKTGEPDLLKACFRDGAGRFAWVAPGHDSLNTFVNSPRAAGCPVFPDNNVWNSRVDGLPLAPESAGIIGSYAAVKFGTVPAFPLNVADAKTPMEAVNFEAWPESDLGAYPLTADMLVEGYDGKVPLPISGGPYKSDAHVLTVRTDECKLYEIYNMQSTGSPYKASSGAIYDLLKNDIRPDGWTSADAAGLPIWPGILTYAELYGEGEIRHMLRFTVNRTRNTYVWPARHYASRATDAALPPMGSRWRLKASFDENTCVESENTGKPFPPEMQRLIRALKHYGMILSDNGLPIKLTTDADKRWGDPESPSSPTWIVNGWSHCISGQDFEVVNGASLMVSPDSTAVAR